ncbi:MAG: archease [Chloroflexi bacterium]|nr:archease [Chloroflexota bacterium]
MSTRGRVPAASDTGFAFVEHTADIGVRAWGPTPAAAFAATAHGMYAITLGKEPAETTGPTIERTVTVSGETWPDLLVNWLAELLFQFSVEGVVAYEYEFSACAPPRCSATITGIAIESEDQVAGGEIKAVTYHKLKIDVQPECTTVQVIFDI